MGTIDFILEALMEIIHVRQMMMECIYILGGIVSDLSALYTITADELMVGDMFRTGGVIYEALNIVDNGDHLIVKVTPYDETDDNDEIVIDPFEPVEVLSFDYSDVED